MKDFAPLAAEKSFAELDAQQKQGVLAVMTAEAFDNLHHILRSASVLDAGAAPPPALAARLRQRMAEQVVVSPRTPFLRRIFQIRVPAWQAAAVFLLAFAALRFWKTNDAPPATPSVFVQTIIRTDTVFIEKTRWKERIVFRKSASPMPAGQENISPGFAAEIPQPVPAVNFSPAFTPEYSASGTPIGEQPELLQFFTQPGQ